MRSIEPGIKAGRVSGTRPAAHTPHGRDDGSLRKESGYRNVDASRCDSPKRRKLRSESEALLKKLKKLKKVTFTQLQQPLRQSWRTSGLAQRSRIPQSSNTISGALGPHPLENSTGICERRPACQRGRSTKCARAPTESQLQKPAGNAVAQHQSSPNSLYGWFAWVACTQVNTWPKRVGHK